MRLDSVFSTPLPLRLHGQTGLVLGSTQGPRCCVQSMWSVAQASAHGSHTVKAGKNSEALGRGLRKNFLVPG